MIAVERCGWDDAPAPVRQRLAEQSPLASENWLHRWKHQDGTPIIWLAHESGQPAAAVAGIEFHPKPLRRFQSLPNNLPAVMWEAQDPRGSEALSMTIAAICRSSYSRAWVTDFDNRLSPGAGWQSRDLHVWIAPISGPDWMPNDDALQRQVRSAERGEVHVVDFSWSAHGEAFLMLCREAELRQKRRIPYSLEFFRSLADAAVADRTILWLAGIVEGKLAATQIYLVNRDLALYWQAFLDREQARSRVGQLLIVAAARRLWSQGVRNLNLGLSPESAESLESYKARWGVNRYEYREYRYSTWLGRLL